MGKGGGVRGAGRTNLINDVPADELLGLQKNSFFDDSLIDLYLGYLTHSSPDKRSTFFLTTMEIQNFVFLEGKDRANYVSEKRDYFFKKGKPVPSIFILVNVTGEDHWVALQFIPEETTNKACLTLRMADSDRVDNKSLDFSREGSERRILYYICNIFLPRKHYLAALEKFGWKRQPKTDANAHEPKADADANTDELPFYYEISDELAEALGKPNFEEEPEPGSKKTPKVKKNSNAVVKTLPVTPKCITSQEVGEFSCGVHVCKRASRVAKLQKKFHPK